MPEFRRTESASAEFRLLPSAPRAVWKAQLVSFQTGEIKLSLPKVQIAGRIDRKVA